MILSALKMSFCVGLLYYIVHYTMIDTILTLSENGSLIIL